MFNKDKEKINSQFTELERNLFKEVNTNTHNFNLAAMKKLHQEVISGTPVLLVYSSQLALKTIISHVKSLDAVYVIHNNFDKKSVGEEIAANTGKVVFHICAFKTISSIRLTDEVNYYLNNAEKIVYVRLELSKNNIVQPDSLSPRFWGCMASAFVPSPSSVRDLQETLQTLVENGRLELYVVPDSLESRIESRISALKSERPKLLVLDNDAVTYLKENKDESSMFSELKIVPVSPLRNCYIYDNGMVVDEHHNLDPQPKQLPTGIAKSHPEHCFMFSALVFNAMPLTTEWTPELKPLYTQVNGLRLPIQRDVSIKEQFFEWDLVTVVISAKYLRFNVMLAAKTKVGLPIKSQMPCDTHASDFPQEFVYRLLNGYTHNYEFVPESVGEMIEKQVNVPYCFTLSQYSSSLTFTFGLVMDVPKNLRSVARNQSYGVMKRALHFDLLEVSRNLKLADSTI